MNLRRLILTIFILTAALVVQGQEQIFEKLRYEDGLPEAEYYNIIQDSLGYYWISSDKGLIRYDGTEYELYNVENGLTENTVLRVWDYGQGRLLIFTYNDLFWVFENDRFKPHPINNLLRNNDGHDLRSESLQGDTLWVGLSRKIVACDLEGNHLVFGDEDCDEPSWLDQRGVENENLSFLVSLKGSDASFCLSYDIENQYPDSLIKVGDQKFLLRLKNNYMWKGYRISSMNKTDSFLVLSKDSNIYSWNWRTQEFLGKTPVSTRVHSVDVQNNRIILGTTTGYYNFEPRTGAVEPMFDFLGEEMSTSVIEDHEGNSWITTTTNGIYKVGYAKAQRLFWPGIKYCGYLGHGVDGTLLVVSNKYTLTAFKGGKILWSHRDRAEIRDVITVNGDYYLSTGIILDRNGAIKEKFAGTSFANHIQWYRNKPLIDVNEHLLTYGEDGLEKSIFWNRRIYCSIELNQELIFGSADGLLRLKGETDSLKPIRTGTILDSVKITHFFHHHNKLFASTSEAGLFVLDPNSFKVLQHYWSQTGFPSHNINKVIASNGLLFASTSSGVFAFEEKQGTFVLHGFLNRSNGFPAGESRDLLIDGSDMYMSTSIGLIKCKVADLIKPVNNPRLFLQSLRVNQMDQTLQNNLSLKHNENNLQLSFNSILLARAMDDDPFRYALVNNGSSDTIWNYLKTKTIQLLDLSPGDYSLVIQAADNYSRFGSNSTELPIHIKAKLINWLWFRVLVVFLLLAYAFYYISSRIRKKRQKDAEKMEFMKIEIESLKSQINPHFLFNSLYVAQAITSDSDTKSLRSYLSRLGRVLRSSIEFTSQEYISLREEIDFISDFLEVELIKKTKDFEYNLQVDKEVDIENTHIPPLLIQPLVENCLKHGFRKVDYKGKILIKMSKNHGQLVVEVIDNGRGLDPDKEILHSTGLRNSIRRLDLLNSQQGTDENTLSIKDREDAQGVIVTITLKG